MLCSTALYYALDAVFTAGLRLDQVVTLRCDDLGDERHRLYTGGISKLDRLFPNLKRFHTANELSKNDIRGLLVHFIHLESLAFGAPDIVDHDTILDLEEICQEGAGLCELIIFMDNAPVSGLQQIIRYAEGVLCKQKNVHLVLIDSGERTRGKWLGVLRKRLMEDFDKEALGW